MVRQALLALLLAVPLWASSGGLGIQTEYMDRSVSPRVDLFRYANGHWLDSTPIPSDRAVVSLDTLIQNKTESQLEKLVTGFLNEPSDLSQPTGKLASVYQDFMDEARINALGRRPIDDLLGSIDRIQSRRELPRIFGELSHIGVPLPFDISINPDEEHSDIMRVHLGQADLTLPDRSYYLDLKDPRLKKIRAEYARYQSALLKDLGFKNPRPLQQSLYALELDWARAQWAREQLRDPKANYHPMTLAQLEALTPQFAWSEWWAVEAIPTHDLIVVGQPDYIVKAVRRLESTPLSVTKAWLKVSILRAFSPYLDKIRAKRQFDFESRVLRGVPEQKGRTQRALSLLDQLLGEALGEAYVTAYFPPTAKAHIETLVQNIINAYRDSLNTLDWLEPSTREAALEKLDHIRLKLGYPDRWRDYSALKVYPGELVRSVRSALDFESKRMVAALSLPVDRDEWAMTPQTVNAYYNPSANEIVFPAAQLQSPYFDVEADDAANYGNIGFIIGHELSHAFDDEGAEFDAHGNMRTWWTDHDRTEFKKRTSVLIHQYSTVTPIPGVSVNGELTLGENIADNVGLTMAWRAYRHALQGQAPPVIEGFTGEERFFISYAQSWMGKMREESLIRQLKTDPHAPMDVRTNLTVRNQAAFHQTFGTQAGDPMWLAPEARFGLW